MKIKNQSDFIKADENLNLPMISADEITITYVDNIWDGPLTGSCNWKNKEYYFYSFDQLEDDGSGDRWPRKYLLIDISQEQLRDVLQVRDVYTRWQNGEITREEYSKFLKGVPMQVIRLEQVIGWFDSRPSEQGQPTNFINSYFDWKEMQNHLPKNESELS